MICLHLTKPVTSQRNDGSLVTADSIDFSAPVPDRRYSFGGQFKNYRWRKYLGRLWQKRYSKYRTEYGDWICRSWNSRNQGVDQLQRFDFYFIKSKAQPPEQKIIDKPYRLMRYHCMDKRLLVLEPVRASIKNSGVKDLMEILGVD